MKAEKKADHKHVLTKLLKAEVGDNIDLIIIPTCMNCDIHALIIDTKSLIQQMSTAKEHDMLTLQHHEVGLMRTLSHNYFHHFDKEARSSFHCNSIDLEDFYDFRVSNTCMLSCQKCGDHGDIQH